ncbi:MAG: zinc-binding dehydrogenase, partial [Nonomuraea sp.]|nr:zinc-binding dehydrogenase [Nonomuraea sp.]
LVASGRVKPPVAAAFPLAEIGAAFDMAGRRDHLGKIVLEVR